MAVPSWISLGTGQTEASDIEMKGNKLSQNVDDVSRKKIRQIVPRILCVLKGHMDVESIPQFIDMIYTTPKIYIILSFIPSCQQ